MKEAAGTFGGNEKKQTGGLAPKFIAGLPFFPPYTGFFQILYAVFISVACAIRLSIKKIKRRATKTSVANVFFLFFILIHTVQYCTYTTSIPSITN